ncbi:ABC transporter substrate-binding protein [Simiduia curdlanivorans]|uniref:Probable sugar-binding periplasmic protein n=1 Tax=Simiduia curdlanivorans TaxID=1492769 RepID=A0ABV8V367_9GAMM|nr:ABC transporter substrate-binding protein [Simiduia curdlanivorans]MDN3640141.1 ABC transporter substrate-binding protein [Simiduia curdlanivorans]
MNPLISGLIIAIACGTLALAAGPAKNTEQKPLTAEVVHWWTSGGESAAIRIVADDFNRRGGHWVDTAIAGGSAARTTVINRILGGSPPTAMQFITGKELDDLIHARMVNHIDGVAKRNHWDKVLPPLLVSSVTREGKFYAIPVNIHGANWLFYNKKLFNKLGLSEPRSWDDFFHAARVLRKNGYIPLAFGGQAWQERTTFLNVLLSYGGKELYLDALSNQRPGAITSPEMENVFRAFARLRDFVDAGSPGRNWNDATNMVITGRAGMQFMGDWAKGEFLAAGMVAERDYGCVLNLGNQPLLMVGGDAFGFSRSDDPNVIAAQELLAETLMNRNTQLAFNQAKGSLPSRTDVDPQQLDACSQKGLKALRDPAKQVPDVVMLMTPDQKGLLTDIVTEFWNRPSMTPEEATEKLAAALAAVI